MAYRKICASLALTLALVAAPVLAQDQQHPIASSPAGAAANPAAPGGMPAGQMPGGMPGGMGAGQMPGGMPGGMMAGAQTPGGQMPGAGGMPMMGMMRMMMGESGMGGMGMMSEHLEGRIAFLKAELKITDAQLPLWNGFAQAMRDNAAAMPGMQGGMMGMSQGATLPDKLAAREKMLSGRLETVRKLKGAADPLYAALSADQKKIADDIMVSPMGMMM